MTVLNFIPKYAWLFVLCLLFTLFIVSTTADYGRKYSGLASETFGSTGRWEKGTREECEDHYLCTNDNMTFVSPDRSLLFNNISACDLLRKKGIKYLNFCGDSFARHLSQAFSLVITGDYFAGSLTPAHNRDWCGGANQFREKMCTNKETSREHYACDGDVHTVYHPLATDPSNFPAKPNSLMIMHEGGHPVFYIYQNNAANGANNVTAYTNKYTRYWGLCNTTLSYPERSNVIYMSHHRRPRDGRHAWESYPAIKAFSEGMKDWFATTNECNIRHYVDVLNMTSDMGHFSSDVWKDLSYDMVHFGRSVNLLKIQMILNYINTHDVVVT